MANFQNDPDSLEFLKGLRNEILEQYQTILISVEESQDIQMKQGFKKNLGTICEFIKQTLQVDGFGDPEQMSNISQLIMDMASQYSND